MAERVYEKSHEFDRVLNYYWAEQEISTGIFGVLEKQKNAKIAADKLAEALAEQRQACRYTGEKTRSLESQRKALETVGGMGKILEKHQEALDALGDVGKALESQEQEIEAVGGMDRLIEQHKMFMDAAREFSPIFTIEPGKRNGQPCIRGMRMTINDVLEYLTSGMTDEEILYDFPYLTQEDLDICRAFGTYMEERFKSMQP